MVNVGMLSLVLAVYFSIFLFSLYQLRQIFDTLRKGNPFVEENAGRLRRMGAAALAYTLFDPAARILGTLLILKHYRIDRAQWDTSLSLTIEVTPLFLAGVLLILSEVFRQGSELRKEQQLTV